MNSQQPRGNLDQGFDLMHNHWDIRKWDKWLGQGQREGAQPRSKPSHENQGLHLANETTKMARMPFNSSHKITKMASVMVQRLARACRRFSSSQSGIVDLRSDTLTLPSHFCCVSYSSAARMKDAMAICDLGDDVYGEDPTVNLLEDTGAKYLGKEASLFVPSGTMANLIAIGVHCQRGDEILCGDQSHIFNWEGGGASSLLGVSSFSIATEPNGTLPLSSLEVAVRPVDDHCAHTRLLVLEDTHNMCGGRVLPMSYLHDVSTWRARHGIKLHIDGARLANAALALGLPAATIAGPADSVTLCLSKGLSAPVGSLLAGSREFILRARRLRKTLGGGMRQVRAPRS
jgi:threonine aldolase